MVMNQADCLLQFRIREADGLCAHAEEAAGKINGVGPVKERRLHPLQISRGRKQFRKLHVSLQM